MQISSMIVKDMIAITAIGTAGLCVYRMISPEDKKQIVREAKRTANDMYDVKKDVTQMANTIKESF